MVADAAAVVVVAAGQVEPEMQVRRPARVAEVPLEEERAALLPRPIRMRRLRKRLRAPAVEPRSQELIE